MSILGNRLSSSLRKVFAPHFLAWGITLFFLVVYASISLYNHYVFRTFAYDLGIKNQTIYDYAHFRLNYNTVLPELKGEINYLANHFEPVLFLFSPLYWIFGSYTLLVVQILFVLAGGWGIYLYFREAQYNRYLPVVAMASFLATWGIFSALSYDFHTNVLAAMLLPWIMYMLERKKFLWAAVIAFILISCKENMALWAVFIGLGMALHYRSDKKRRNFSLGVSAFSLVWFVLIMQVFMPYFAGGKLPYMHFSYSALGQTWSEAVQTVFTRPAYTARLLFSNHMKPGGFNDGAKMQLHWFVLMSGGILLLARPQFLLMLLPVYAQKMFSDDPVKWSIFYQYSIEFVPVIILAAFSVISALRDHRAQLAAGVLIFLSAFDMTKASLDMWKPLAYSGTINNFYQRSHYSREIPADKVRQALQHIPEDASVSATSFLVPHLAARREIYQYPEHSNANWIAWANDGASTYPQDSETYLQYFDSLRHSGAWQVIFDEEYLVILKRR